LEKYMTLGIRAFVNQTFNATLPQRAELGNIAFRAEVMNQAIMAFGISVGSAATHYNHALKAARAANPEAVAGLGRPEDKKGGRKAIYLVDVIKVKTGEVVASGLSKAKAELLVAKAAATTNKARLAIKAQEAVAEAATA
jgi:hypothetical protein